MTRLLFTAYTHGAVRLVRIDGGGLRNAIPRESTAVFAMNAGFVAAMEATLNHCRETIAEEYKVTDPNLEISWSQLPLQSVSVLKDADQKALINALYACPNGILRMSPSIAGLVQTSTNLARVVLEDGQFKALMLSRSSVDSEKREMTRIIEAAFGALEPQISHTGEYPGWTPEPEAPIIQIMQKLYKQLFDGQAKVAACHAGLECGILGRNYPGMQMISFGPNIRGAHSPDEKVQISSVQKFWKFLLATLEQTPKKA